MSVIIYNKASTYVLKKFRCSLKKLFAALPFHHCTLISHVCSNAKICQLQQVAMNLNSRCYGHVAEESRDQIHKYPLDHQEAKQKKHLLQLCQSFFGCVDHNKP